MAPNIQPEFLPSYNYDDYKNWTDQWELIEGIPYSMMPLPTLQHQRINKKILIELEEKLKGCSGCEAFMPVDWKVNDKTVVQPDALVSCIDHEGKFITHAPSLIFEILSPSTAIKDQHVKMDLYLRNKVKYYVIISPENQLCYIYGWADGGYKLLLTTHDGNFDFSIEPCIIHFNFKNIWD